MPCRFGLLCIVLSLVLSACAPGILVQSPPAAGAMGPAATPPSAMEAPLETGDPLATRPPDPDPTPTQSPTMAPTQIPVEAGAFENSVLVAAWFGGNREHRLYPLDPESGQGLTGYPPIAIGEIYAHAFSPDRRTLAFATPSRLQLVDLDTWTERVYDLNLARHVTGLAYDMVGRRLAIVSGDLESQITIFDLEEEKVTAQRSLEIVYPHLKFTSDGRGLMVYGAEVKNRFTVNEMAAGPPQALLLDPGDLSLRWSAELDGVRDGIFPKDPDAGEKVDLAQPDSAIYLSPGLAFAPGRDVLYVIHADEDKLTTVDFAAQRLETVEFRTPLSLFERLLALTAGVARAKVPEGTSKQAVISPDGRLIYVLGLESTAVQNEGGEWEIVSKPLGLQVIQTADGGRLDRFETEANEISLSPDGRFLYLSRWQEGQSWTEIFETSKGEVVDRMEGVLRPALRMSGEILLAGSDYRDGTRMYQTVVDPDRPDGTVQWTAPPLAWLSAP